jgi:hypothetical protein
MRLQKRLATLVAGLSLLSNFAQAEHIANPIGLFSGLDKITAVTTMFEVNLGEEVTFGDLKIKMSACYTKPITEQPDTAAFVQIFTGNKTAPNAMIFSGWLFAENPSLNALENPVYDIWLTGCKDPNAPPLPVEAAPAPKPETGATQPETPED